MNGRRMACHLLYICLTEAGADAPDFFVPIFCVPMMYNCIWEYIIFY